MTQSAPETSDDGQREIDQAAGHPGAAHDLGRQDEKRHRHKGEDVELGENPLRQNGKKLRFAHGDERQNRHGSHQVGERGSAD